MTKPKKNPAQRGRKSAASLAIVQPLRAVPEPAPRHLPAPPKHLSKAACAWWCEVVRDYDLSGHHLRLLESACAGMDRAERARLAVAEQGMTFVDGNGVIKSNPAVAIERDSRTLLARLIRELNLDEDAPHAS